MDGAEIRVVILPRSELALPADTILYAGKLATDLGAGGFAKRTTVHWGSPSGNPSHPRAYPRFSTRAYCRPI